MNGLLIIKAGSTFPELAATRGDFEDWVRSGMGVEPRLVSVVDVTRGQALPDQEALGGVVITGSHAMVTERLGWSERTAAWLKRAVRCRIPILGICYGHQLLAHALGGQVDNNPHGAEFGTVEVTLEPAARQDQLFGAMPPVFNAHVTHLQSVIALPPNAARIAWSAREPNQAFVVGCAWGVQFHPEFDAGITRAYIRALHSNLAESGQSPDELQRGCVETQESAGLLVRFAQLCAARMQKGG